MGRFHAKQAYNGSCTTRVQMILLYMYSSHAYVHPSCERSMDDEVQLWVRPEVMELGVLPVIPPDKISIEMLSRLLQYAQDLGERGYPCMSYDTWKHIAVKKHHIEVVLPEPTELTVATTWETILLPTCSPVDLIKTNNANQIEGLLIVPPG
ncbi:TBCC domain-containing protein 1, partial [Halocaridina rubra]